MAAEPLREIPDEISVTEARKILGELAEAAENGRVIHLTKRGQRIAKIMPEHSQADVDEAFMQSADWIIDRYSDMFDRMAEL
ncbi:type II toxin-antitoxin system prevent-host-death family antitoxin [Phytoactinopolyspora alkaliphila]|uniref:Type II toxin-antitoxin system prevent-host-death family antitoxin n=1 Tax=Phytoactinopolyspora alkaliphila TaxID=1783498 RepID=A0A6N9YRJ6_9ACTN|nr:type II toxin-antitoxin system prevent-host-death family antitoxin [Phytoactinopolyspora alkaliphila]NED97686.1 type II toxin-antitoxin system prevent-host-death family antitoxin [Phytoactinopolyspora alkaliphila]